MSDPIQVHSTELVPERTVANLSPVHRPDDSLVRPSASVAQIEQAFRDYTTLCERLLVPDDYQQIGNKSFRKKSAWRKLATAFGVSVEMLWKEYERDGRHIVRAEVMSRAVAPNGRFMDGLGACDAFERCCENPCKKKSWNNHTCCTADCNGFVHFSKPNHDIPATAMTRATNRACADLFGMGEVSAEEVTGDDHAPQVDPEAWFRSVGWKDRAHHDDERKSILALAAELDAKARGVLKAWADEEGSGLAHPATGEPLNAGWGTAWTPDFAAQIAHKVELLTQRPDQTPEGEGPPNPAPTPETPAPAPESAPVGDSEPLPDPDPTTMALIAFVESLPARQVGEALEARGAALSGASKIRQQRLAKLLAGEGWTPGRGHLPGTDAGTDAPTAATVPPGLPEPLCAWCGHRESTKGALPTNNPEGGWMHDEPCRIEWADDKAAAEEPF